jgi:hypothetical protein
MTGPVLGAMSTKTVGFMGESLTAFLLELEFGKRGLRVIKLGEEDVEWDLFIFEASEGTPFTRPTAIQVKTRSRTNWWTYPTREKFLLEKEKVEGMGYDLWYSFIHYMYAEGHLRFGAYLVPARDIREEDFTMRREFGKDVEMLKINTMRDRARLRFRSRKMGIEDLVGTSSPSKGKGGREHDASLGVALDLAGDWGEDMAAFLLESEFKGQDLKVAYIGRGYWYYDLFIDGPVDKTPFTRQAAISVKANTTDRGIARPSFEELSKARSALDAKGICLWLAVLQCYYTNCTLGFGMYLIDSMVLDRDDFVDVPSNQQWPDLLSLVKARKKATVRLWTGEIRKS